MRPFGSTDTAGADGYGGRCEIVVSSLDSASDTSAYCEADVALGLRDIGIFASAVAVNVCPDELVSAERAAGLLDIHDGEDDMECAVDSVDAAGLGTRICESRTLEGTVTSGMR